jgi:hypothetical protein
MLELNKTSIRRELCYFCGRRALAIISDSNPEALRVHSSFCGAGKAHATTKARFRKMQNWDAPSAQNLKDAGSL